MQTEILYTLTQIGFSNNKINYVASISNLTLQQVYNEIQNTTDANISEEQKQELLKNAGLNTANDIADAKTVNIHDVHCAIFLQ